MIEKYTISGPLTSIWLKNYLGESKKLTSEKIAYLPSIISQYKIIFQTLKILGIRWIQLEDPVFVTDILPEFHNNIIQAYQDLLDDAPNIMLVTYFGGIDENINWIKKIPFQGLHIDLDSAPEQIMFVLKSDLMKSLKILSLGGIKETDPYFISIQEYIDNYSVHNPEIWLNLYNKNIKSKTEKLKISSDTLDIVQLYVNQELDCPDGYPKILALKKLLQVTRSEYPDIKFTTQSLSELTCFMKNRDKAGFIKNIEILSNL